MSLFSASVVNTLTGVVAKKSAEVAAASGALLTSAGILIGAHGIGLWNSAHTVQSQATSARQSLFNTQSHLQNMEMRIKYLSKKMPAVCATSSIRAASAPVCTSSSHRAYSAITENLRALYLDLPQWAAQNGVTISNIMSNQGLMSGPSMRATPVPGYPGISQQVIKVSGTYATLSGLHHFVQAMPTGIELTGITIQKKHFTGEITVYGIAA
ncbi:hypothetical protein [Acidithiobacillus thiooxidans]|uniref:hypothetical protein n=1 Tax=Acidithiobacillus thiooxidans TaxID=930 RepID=UPI0009D95DD9|nr:hypothetical protein [Acidithiobacillus thiooxidans]